MRLLSAVLGGNLDCDGATFRADRDVQGNPSYAFVADGLTAGGNAFLREVEATGTVRLLSAVLGGNLECDRARFRAERNARGDPGKAFQADGLKVGGNVFLRNVQAIGEVQLLGAVLGGNLECDGAMFRAENDAAGDTGLALVLDGARVTGTLFLRGGAKVEGFLDLTGAEFGTINDAADSWPAAGLLLLNRCRYGAFIGGRVDADSRLD